MKLQNLCIYCGSSPGNRPEYVAEARCFGRTLVEQDIGLVYGGASIGLMGVVADTVLAAGGTVTGVIPRALLRKEVVHHGLTELVITESMHARKAKMAQLADAFVALPGGIGTFEELFEIWTWAQLGFHRKPCALFNPRGYFDPLVQFLDHAVEEGFLKPVHRSMLLVSDSPENLLEALRSYRPPVIDKWVGAEEI
jgi:uncharacterized protein (TIGR00730 family)